MSERQLAKGPRYAAAVTPYTAAALTSRFAWALVLFAHVVLAGFVWRLLPHGFPLLHQRTLLGTLIPAVMILGALGVGWLLWRAPRMAARCLPVIPAFWSSAALGLLLIFPETGWAAARPMGLIALPLALLAGFTCRGDRVRSLLPAILIGAAFGQLAAYCERPAPASTRPWSSPPPQRGTERAEAVPAQWELAPDLVVEGSAARVTWRTQRATISIAPVLTFDRTSPDGFWSIFAPLAAAMPATAITTAQHELRLWTANGALLLHVRPDFSLPGEATRGARLEAWTWLDRPVYSHLNSFTTVLVSGHRQLGLRFSPCPSALIRVTHADYPSGAPARFAYVDAAHRFHIVQAADAEKGPFSALAECSLSRDETLAVDLVELSEQDGAFARLEVLDFEHELSTALSPTAGYGVPENAIEFGLESSAPSSPAHLVFTLAASGVGRGWDSVAHAAGTYANRIVLRSLERPAVQSAVHPAGPSLHDVSPACTAIARDIAALKPKYPQLAEFDASRVSVSDGECSISYAYRTHRSNRPGGWTAHVPNPDPDGLWFHVGIWDPRGSARAAQINTQPGASVYTFGEDHITFLILEGSQAKPLRSALRQLLKQHGLGPLVR